MNERMGARPWVAHTQLEHARMLLRRDGDGDRRQAAELLARARATFRELGMHEPPSRDRRGVPGGNTGGTGRVLRERTIHLSLVRNQMTFSFRRMLVSLFAVAALGSTMAATADAAVSIRGTTPDPGLRHYLQTRPDDTTRLTNKQRNPADPHQRWTQTSAFGGHVFKNEVGQCIVDFGFESNGSNVRANLCNPFNVTLHFRWQLLPGTVAGTVHLGNWRPAATSPCATAARSSPSTMRGPTNRHREFKLGTF